MNQEIYNKLHTALYSISPLASDRDRIIGEMGEVIWLTTLEKMLMSLPEDKREEVVALLNIDDLAKSIDIFEANNVDVDAILQEVSKSVLDEVLASNK